MFRRLAAVVAALGLTLLLAGVALGHAELDTASPGPDETVTVEPSDLTATFTAALDPSRSSIVVKDDAGAEVARGEAGAVQADGLTIVVPLPALRNGTYSVEWTAAAAEDGHIERGTYAFTIAIPASPSPSPSPSPTASPSPPASASGSPSASPAASPSQSPAASPDPSPEPSSGLDPTIVLPIAVAIVVVGIVALNLVRRRST